MNQLMIHAGGRPASLEQIELAKTPQATRSHQTINHGLLVGKIKKYTEAFTGMEIVQEQYALRDGKDYLKKEKIPDAQMFGVLTLRDNSSLEGRPWTTTLGLRNSHDKAFAFGLSTGSRVFVCDNLAFSGDHTVKRKHTTNVFKHLDSDIIMMLQQVKKYARMQDERYNLYQGVEIDARDADHIVMNCVRDGSITTQSIPKVLQEYEHPSFEEFAPRTVWSLFNAVTEVSKGTPFMTLNERTINLQKVMDSFCEFDTASYIEADYEVIN
jgi:hypothetical protein